jgi:uncharacterized protein (DUF488 family)
VVARAENGGAAGLILRVYTIGHSNQPAESFVGALLGHTIQLVVDVRRFPTSRRHPHFSGPRLSATLQTAGIDYLHEPALGGHRTPAPHSPNTAWREDAFRGYADYMGTEAFGQAITRLLELAEAHRLAVMCAERSWRDCHRGLIADYLKVREHEAIHIVSSTETELHPYTRPARLVDGELSYRGLL